MHRASKRISRSQLVTASEKFTNACIGLTETDATVIQLIHFFERSNRFYCRFGDGTQATKSCLQSIHANDDTKDAEEPRTTCTRKQLTAYFLKTISFDPKRIERMEPLLNQMLKDQHKQFRESKEYEESKESKKHVYPVSDRHAQRTIAPPTAPPPIAPPTAPTTLAAPTVEEQQERRQNIAHATAAVEKERQRRVSVHVEHDAILQKERKGNQALAVQMMEDERARRMSMDQRAIHNEQMLKQRNIQMVSEMVEKERERRIIMNGNVKGSHERRRSSILFQIIGQQINSNNTAQGTEPKEEVSLAAASQQDVAASPQIDKQEAIKKARAIAASRKNVLPVAPQKTTAPESLPPPSSTASKSSAAKQAEVIFNLLDEDGSGTVEKAEFKERLRENEQLAKVFFSNSGFAQPMSTNGAPSPWSELAIAKNTKKIFAAIDTTPKNSRAKRLLRLDEIVSWCEDTGAEL